jgi:hypothetical protein
VDGVVVMLEVGLPGSIYNKDGQLIPLDVNQVVLEQSKGARCVLLTRDIFWRGMQGLAILTAVSRLSARGVVPA